MATPSINQDQVRFALGALQQFEKVLDKIQYLTYIPRAISLIRGLFYPAEAIAFLSHQFSAPHLESSSKAIYQERIAPLNTYVIDYKKAFQVGCVLIEKTYPDHMESLLAVKKILINSDILDKIAKEDEKPLHQWITELRASDETIGAYAKKHPFAEVALNQLFGSGNLSSIDQIPLKTFTQIPNMVTILTSLQDFTFSPPSMAKDITSWKWELEDPDDFQWLCTKVVLNTLLILPFAYAAKETWGILLGRTVSISYTSLMKQIFVTSLLAAGTENIAARYLKSLDSQAGNQ